MDRGSILKIAIGVIAILLLVYFYLSADKTHTYNWNTHFKSESKDPYGCYLFHELIKRGRESDQFVEIKGPVSAVLADADSVGASYIFVGEDWYYSNEDFWALADFVENGNNVFILSRKAPYDLLNEIGIYSSIYFDSYIDKHTVMRLEDSSALDCRVDYISEWKPESYDWQYADSISDGQFEVLGTLSPTQVNFFKVNYEQGAFYFHLSPIVFTNFNLREEDKLDYANEVLKNIGDRKVYWDSFSSIPYNGEGENTESPLSFILSQESLRLAWYLLLLLALVYLVLYTKRKQRIIPVINSPSNTSLDFVKTIGAMYYHKQSHLKIVQHQLNLFLTFIRTKYGLSTSHLDEGFIKKASLKSGVKQGKIDEIIQEARRLERLEDVKTKDLIEYNKLTEAFYRNCR